MVETVVYYAWSERQTLHCAALRLRHSSTGASRFHIESHGMEENEMLMEKFLKGIKVYACAELSGSEKMSDHVSGLFSQNHLVNCMDNTDKLYCIYINKILLKQQNL